MAAGVPATGLGGIYYILLTIGLLFYKFAKKVYSKFKKQLCFAPDDRVRMRRFFPTIAFATGVALLIFLNATGFRFTVPGTQPATLTLDYLWVIGAFAVSAAIICFLLINFRAQKVMRK